MARFFIPCDVADYAIMQESQGPAPQSHSFTTYGSVRPPSVNFAADLENGGRPLDRAEASRPQDDEAHPGGSYLTGLGGEDSVQSSCPLPRQPSRHVQLTTLPPLPVPEIWRNQQRALAIPSLIVTHPTPGSTPPPLSPISPPASTGSEPPAYITCSPPKYAPTAHKSETALLLSPPPPFSDSAICSLCFESTTPCRRCLKEDQRADWVVRFLILLNVIVWGIVIMGYYREWESGGLTGFGCVDPYAGGYFGGVLPHCYNGGIATSTGQTEWLHHC